METTLIIITTLITFFLTLKKYNKMQENLDSLKAQVTETKTVMASAVVLLGGLKKRLDDALTELENGDDGAALDELSKDLGTGTDDLAAAVVANTPAAPAQ